MEYMIHETKEAIINNCKEMAKALARKLDELYRLSGESFSVNVSATNEYANIYVHRFLNDDGDNEMTLWISNYSILTEGWKEEKTSENGGDKDE